MAKTGTVDPAPRSAVSAMVGWLGLAGLAGWFLLVRFWPLPPGPYIPLVGILIAALPMAGWSVFVDRVHRNPSTGIDWDGPPRGWAEALDTGLLKLAGLWATWGVLALLYCTIRTYWSGGYLYAMRVLGLSLVPLLILSVPYVLWLERRLVEPRDGAWAAGRWILSGFRVPDAGMAALLAGHARAWAIKGFYTAFMLSTMPGNWDLALHADFARMLHDPVAAADGLVAIMFLIDVTIGTVGYLLTFRPLDAHIRSGNPYLGAWLAALICYPPFTLGMAGGPLDFSVHQLGWVRATSDHPLLAPVFAIAMILLTGVYAWATMAFGIRFSNLTDRGILTNGAYRFTKHPAYLAKNLFWWLQAVPWLTTTGSLIEGARNGLLLLALNGIYYWRARTEERHLRADPDYRAYEDWMARNGLITKWFARAGGWWRGRGLAA